tara:strand:+ start:9464 stop:9631 length:168 start_codon:yes stop_codon:yes gene_type:complete
MKPPLKIADINGSYPPHLQTLKLIRWKIKAAGRQAPQQQTFSLALFYVCFAPYAL